MNLTLKAIIKTNTKTFSKTYNDYLNNTLSSSEIEPASTKKLRKRTSRKLGGSAQLISDQNTRLKLDSQNSATQTLLEQISYQQIAYCDKSKNNPIRVWFENRL
jgi:hypothetical protein